MIGERIKEIRNELPEGVRLVAVSKFHPNEAIEEAYRAGQRIFGESKVQEMTAKYESLPKDIEWHFIGHLQTNKVKYIVPYVALIHGIDSYKLLAEVDKQAAKAGRRVNCLLQLHIAREETKFGFSFDECRQMLAEGQWRQLQHIRLCGLMGMATNTDNVEQIKEEFRSLSSSRTLGYRLWNRIKSSGSMWLLREEITPIWAVPPLPLLISATSRLMSPHCLSTSLAFAYRSSPASVRAICRVSRFRRLHPSSSSKSIS